MKNYKHYASNITVPMAAKRGSMVCYLKKLFPIDYSTLLSLGHAISYCTIKPLCLHYYGAYDQQTMLGGDLS